MKKSFLLQLLILASCFAMGQAPAVQWQKSLGGSGNEWANCIRQTTDFDSYIVAGISAGGDRNMWVVELLSNGSINRESSFGSLNDDGAVCVAQTTDGFIVGGWMEGRDSWVVSFDDALNVQWRSYMGNEGYTKGVQQTNDDNYIVIEFRQSGSHGGYEYWVTKLHYLGFVIWQKSLGGSSDDVASSIQQTSDGGYIVAGSSSSNDGDVTGNHGNADYWVVKLNGLGIIQWQRSLGGPLNDEASSIQQTNDGGYIVAGKSYSEDGDIKGHHGNKDSADCWVVKLDEEGKIQWQKSLGGTGEDVGKSIQQTSDGGFIVAGSTTSNNGDVTGHHGSDNTYDYWLIKLDHTGSIQWQKTLGGSGNDWGASMQQTTDFGYIVAGTSNSNDGDVTGNHGGDDYWIVKLAPDITTPLQLLQFTAQNQGQKVVLNWQTATEKEVSHFNIQRSTDGIHFNTLSKVYAAGNSTSLKTYSYTDNDASSCGGKIYYRLQMMDKDGSSSYSKVVSVLWNAAIPSVRIYPNPARDILHVEGKQLQSITLTDLLGRTVMSRSLAGTDINSINLNGLAKGQYLVMVKDKSGNVQTEKLVVQ